MEKLITKLLSLQDTADVTYESLSDAYIMMSQLFPDKARKVSELQMELANKQAEAQAKAQPDIILSDCKDLVPVNQPGLEITTISNYKIVWKGLPEGFLNESEDSDYLDLKKLFKLTASRCHPDKCRGLPYYKVKDLSNYFLKAKVQYKEEDIEGLECTYAFVCFIRNELHKVPKYIERSLRTRISELEDSYKYIYANPMYPVFRADKEKQYDIRNTLFEDLLDNIIAQLKSLLGT